MKVLKFYMNNGIPQTVTIEKILGHPYIENNQPHIVQMKIERKAVCNAEDRKALWSFSKFLATKGNPIDYWYNMNCYENPYKLYWEEYTRECLHSFITPIDDLLDVMLEADTFSGENFIKVIVNDRNDGEYNLEDYVNLKKADGNLDRFFDACI